MLAATPIELLPEPALVVAVDLFSEEDDVPYWNL